MYANARSGHAECLIRRPREPLWNARFSEQILLVVGTVLICVVSRLPLLITLGLPRLLGLTAAFILGLGALLALCHAAVARLLPDGRGNKLDATECRSFGSIISFSTRAA